MPVMYETYEGISGIMQGDANETSPMASEYIKTYSVNPCVRSMKRDLLHFSIASIFEESCS